MRVKITVLVLILTFAIGGQSIIRAGNVEIDPSIQTFWAKFKAAVTRVIRKLSRQ